MIKGVDSLWLILKIKVDDTSCNIAKIGNDEFVRISDYEDSCRQLEWTISIIFVIIIYKESSFSRPLGY